MINYQGSNWTISYRDKNASNFRDYVVIEEHVPTEYTTRSFIPRTVFVELMKELELPNE